MLAAPDRAAMEASLLRWLAGVHRASAPQPAVREALLRLRLQDRTADSRVTLE